MGFGGEEVEALDEGAESGREDGLVQIGEEGGSGGGIEFDAGRGGRTEGAVYEATLGGVGGGDAEVVGGGQGGRWDVLENRVQVRPDSCSFAVVCILDNGIADGWEEIVLFCCASAGTADRSTNGHKEVAALSIQGQWAGIERGRKKPMWTYQWPRYIPAVKDISNLMAIHVQA